jgi:uncharacterized CHY-type Zn-finger protein
MCKHVLNAQVSFRAPCCHRWFDCTECHEELSDHRIENAIEVPFVCKKCRQTFHKDLLLFGEEDEVCPHCQNPFVIPAETPPLKQMATRLEKEKA